MRPARFLPPLPALPAYTFGSMSLGVELDRLDQDLAVATAAMRSGVWFHSSPTYHRGFTFLTLRLAFDADRAHVPRLIIKIRDSDPRLLRFEVEDTCRRLGVARVDIAQLVMMRSGPGGIVDDLARGGPLATTLAELIDRGLLGTAVLATTAPSGDDDLRRAVEERLFPGYMIFLNPWERSCSDATWAALRDSGAPILALRTLAGGRSVRPSEPRAAERFDALAALALEAGCADAATFAVRWARALPGVVTTIGGTARHEHLDALRTAAAQPPLPPAIATRVEALLSDARRVPLP